MATHAVERITFSLPVDIVQRLRKYAEDREVDVDRIVAEAIDSGLPIDHEQIDRRVQASIDRLSALSSEQLETISRTTLPSNEFQRLSALLEMNRLGTLRRSDQDELDELQTRSVDIAADRVLAGKILRDRRLSG